ncbi:MAG: hypothetical protein NZ874_05840 [Fimbriimonadales bacterium]|nr:hypothetical protein [Fimbriimonadales bacterium]
MWRRTLLGVAGLALSTVLAQTDSTPNWTRPPNVVVVIQVQPDGLHPIVWTFDKRVPHAAVRARIEQFAQWSQRGVAYVEISDDTLKRNPKPDELFTVASFASGGLVNLQEGTLNLTPVARTFADLPVVHVYVLLPRRVEYAGYFQYATPHLQMWTQAEPALWRSVIHIHTPDPAVLEIPLKRPKPQPAAETPPAPPVRPPLGWLIGLILLAALLAGAGIFWATTKLLKRQTETPTVQAETDL